MLTLGTDSGVDHVELGQSFELRWAKKMEEDMCKFKAELEKQWKPVLKTIEELVKKRHEMVKKSNKNKQNNDSKNDKDHRQRKSNVVCKVTKADECEECEFAKEQKNSSDAKGVGKNEDSRNRDE